MEFESKEFDLRLKQLDSHAEHLRTTHFTLLITVFVVLVGTFMTMRPDYTRALEQLDDIRLALKVTGVEGPAHTGESDWDPKWLDRKLYASQAEQLFPGLVLNGDDFEGFLAQLGRRDAYQLFGHAFTVEKTPRDVSVERLYANTSGGPLFYLDDALRRTRQPGRRIVAFFYPCIHFADIPSQNMVCRISETVDADVAFLDERAIDGYKMLRTRPRNLSEFRLFWARLNTLRVQVPLLADNVDRFIALVLHTPQDSTAKEQIGEVVSCGSVRVQREKTPWLPKEAAPIGIALSTYFLDGDRKDFEHTLAAALPCNLGPYATVDSSTIHWKTGHYAYVDPFHSFQSRYSGRDSNTWFILQFPLSSLDWRSVDGPRLLDPRLASVAHLDFEPAFPDLARIAKRLGDLNWADLRTVLEDQSIKQSETVSVFGVSVPLALLFFIGTCAILANQMYMIAYISRFISLANGYPSAFQAQNFPWIGLLESRFWSIITAMTVSFFPFAVILGVAVTTLLRGVDLPYALLSVFALGLEVTVAICLGLGIRKLRFLPRSADRQLRASDGGNRTPDPR